MMAAITVKLKAKKISTIPFFFIDFAQIKIMIMIHEAAAKEISGREKYGLMGLSTELGVWSSEYGVQLCGYFSEFHDAHPFHDNDNGIGRIKFKPPLSEVDAVRTFMVIVLHEFAHEKKVERHCVLAVIVVIVMTVTVLMTTPVYDGALYRSHKKMNGQQGKAPPIRCKLQVEQEIQYAECNAYEP